MDKATSHRHKLGKSNPITSQCHKLGKSNRITARGNSARTSISIIKQGGTDSLLKLSPPPRKIPVQITAGGYP
jgi:hypothetical protein